MAFDGEAIKRDFILISENPNPTTPTLDVLATTYDECCNDTLIRVFAEPTNDQFKNDKTTVVKSFSNAVTSVAMTLEEYTVNGWVTSDTLTNNDYGTYYALGFIGNSIAYTLDWNLIQTAFGNQSFRVKFEGTIAFGGTVTVYSDNYCLHTYNALSVDGTVKLEYYLNGTFADPTDDRKVIDYGTSNLYNSMRLDGIFGQPKSEKEEEFIKYQSGQELFVKSEQTPEYTLLLKPQTPDILRKIQYEVFQQDSIFVTDYNRNNHYSWIQKEVKVTGGFAPEWDLQAKKAAVTLTMTNTYNNFKRKL